MKTFGILIIAASCQFGWCSADELKDYPVRDIPTESEKFKTIYTAVAAEQLAAIQRARQMIRIKVVQNIANQRYLADFRDQLIAVDLATVRKLADDTWIDVQIEDTGQIYEYVAVLGNKKSVHLYREVHEPPMMTAAEFVERLKKGESFLIRVAGKQKTCEVCKGAGNAGGNVPTNGKAKGESGCVRCSGSGWISTSSPYRVLW